MAQKSESYEAREETDNSPVPKQKISSSEQPQLGMTGETLLNELLAEITLMYTYTREAGISVPYMLANDISNLLSGTPTAKSGKLQ